MTNKFSLWVAYRYLWSKRSEAFVTIISIVSFLGILIGVVVLCVTMAVMTGFEQELRERFVGAESHILIRKFGDKIPSWQQVESAAKSVPGVSSVSPYVFQQGLLRTEGRSAGVMVRGVLKGSAGEAQLLDYAENSDAVKDLYRPNEDFAVDSPRLPGLLIGRELARSLGIVPGDAVALLSPELGSSPFGLVPRFKRYRVVGTYHSGLVEYEGTLVYVDMREAQSFFRLGDVVTGLEVRVTDVDNSSRLAGSIRAVLGGIGQGFVVQDWTERNHALWGAIQLEKRVYFLVLLLIVVMASFSVVTTLIMIVLEKRRDIAVLMTVGASSAIVARIFFFQGTIIGSAGTIAGLVLGYLGCKGLQVWGFPIPEEVFQMSSLPIRIEPLNFILIGSASFLICCLATLYPAWRASKLQPSDVLRYE